MSFDPMLSTKRILKKLGGNKSGGGVVLPKTTIIADPSPVFTPFNMVAGKSYTMEVSAEGSSIKGTVTPYYVEDEAATIVEFYAVTVAVLDEPLTDEAGQAVYGLIMDLPAGATVTITETETIVPIDPKFIPGVCLPVVKLSTTWANNAIYTAEENAKLKAAWENDTPIVVKCGITVENGGWDYSSAVWYKAYNYYSGDNKMLAFALALGTKTLLIYSMDDGETWGCHVD